LNKNLCDFLQEGAGRKVHKRKNTKMEHYLKNDQDERKGAEANQIYHKTIE